MRFTFPRSGLRRRMALAMRGILCLTLTLPLGVAFADGDDEEQPTKLVWVRRDLMSYRAPAAVNGPNLGTPSDLIAQGHESHWNGDPGDERIGWLQFQQPAVEGRPFSIDELVTTLQHLRGEIYETVDGAVVGVDERGVLYARVPETEAERTRQDFEWAIASLAPSISVRAQLGRSVPDPRLRALGSARVWPGRWTPVFFQKDEIPAIVDFEIEVAQEAVVADPVIANLVEGCELYVRFHPGESRSLVEVWVADVEHLDTQRIDLSEVRNIPEAAGLGVLNFPRTAVDRAFACFVVPTGASVKREIVWTRKDRVQRLQLEIQGPTASPAPRAIRGDLALTTLRVGAAHGALEFEARTADTEMWSDRQRTWLEEQHGALDEHPNEGEHGISTLSGGVLASAYSLTTHLDGLRADLVARERMLKERTVTMEVWRVPQEAYRAAMTTGTIGIGRVLPRELLTTWRESGAASSESVRMPVLAGAGAGFRVGESVPGVIDFDVEIAQQSAGSFPRTWALFSGVFSDLVVHENGRAVHAHATGEVVWADVAAGTAELVFRPPLSMRPNGPIVEREGDFRRWAKLPLLSGGSASFDRGAGVSPGADADTVLDVSVRGDVVTLVLVGVR